MLTDEERLRFLQYLEDLVRSNRQLVEQFKKLPETPPTRRMADGMEIEAKAAEIIARRLRTTESETIR